MANVISKDEIYTIYRSSLEESLKFISNILIENESYSDDFFAPYQKVLGDSTDKILKKWEGGNKYLRTEFVAQVLEVDFPKNKLKTSIYMDAIINILDDMLDENLSKADKMYYVIEILRVISLFNYQHPSNELEDHIGSYFNKLITLAVAENNYLETIKKTQDEEKIKMLMFKLLAFRSMDIDVFLEIANEELKVEGFDKVLKAGRLFRGFNIFKKDILDIEHDNEQGSESLISYLVNSKVGTLRSHIKNMEILYHDGYSDLDSGIDKFPSIVKKSIANFQSMFEDDVKISYKYSDNRS